MTYQHQWIFKRNCSFTPRQVGLFYLSQVGFALIVAIFFYARGIWIVLPFTLTVLLILAIALLIYARHATDFESINIDGTELTLQIKNGLKEVRYDWNISWVKINSELNKNDLVTICYQGNECELGRFIHVSQRQSFLEELKSKLLLGW